MPRHAHGARPTCSKGGRVGSSSRASDPETFCSAHLLSKFSGGGGTASSSSGSVEDAASAAIGPSGVRQSNAGPRRSLGTRSATHRFAAPALSKRVDWTPTGAWRGTASATSPGAVTTICATPPGASRSPVDRRVGSGASEVRAASRQWRAGYGRHPHQHI
jgi:hypothetical protein